MSRLRDAEERWRTTFGPTPRINKGVITNVERQRINRYVTNNADILIAKRERVAKRVARVLSGFYLNRWAEAVIGMRERGDLREIEDDVAQTYRALKTPTTSDARVIELIKQESTDRQITAFIESRVENALSRIDLSKDERLMLRALVLLAEPAALFVHRQVRSLRSATLVDVGLLQFERRRTERTAKALNIDQIKIMEDFGVNDDLFVDIVMGKPPDQLIGAIGNRQNYLQMRKQMFSDFKKGMKQDLYHRIGGAAGAEEIARRISAEYQNQLLAKGGMAAQKRALLWARTEGAIIQNDALMMKGIEAGMDAKRWVNVGDDRVRTFATGPGDHVVNMGDGIIPIQDVFTDGSTDGGSGSVSPFNCRCTVGPAMLSQRKTPAATGPAPSIPSITEPPAIKPRPQQLSDVLESDVEDFLPINPSDIVDEAEARLEEILNALGQELDATFEVFDAASFEDDFEGSLLEMLGITSDDGVSSGTGVINDALKEVANRVAKRAGISFSEADAIITEWNVGNNEFLNAAASKIMKQPIPNYMLEEFGDIAVDKATEKMAIAMYEETQEFFARRNITHVDLYRGVRVDADSLDAAPRNGVGTMLGTPNVSSWSVSESIAHRFADQAEDDYEYGLLMHARVPVSRILSTGVTGAGTISETEMTVLSAPSLAERVFTKIIVKPRVFKRFMRFSFAIKQAAPFVIDFGRMPSKLALRNAAWLHPRSRK